MLFSVVIPVYNAGKYLGACLDSLSCQTWNDFEVVLVDDGSSDASPALCEAYAAGHSNVTVLLAHHGGPFCARICGIEHARGDYVVFLDADDCLRPDALELCAQFLNREPVDMLCFDYSFKDDFSVRKDSSHGSPLTEGLYRGEQMEKVREAVCSGGFNNLWCKMVRRALCPPKEALAVGGRRPAHAEDLLYLLLLMENVHSVGYVHEALYWYRQHTESTQGTFKDSLVSDLGLVVPRLMAYGQIWGMQARALAGVALQYVNLLKILFSTPMSASKRRERFLTIMRELCKLPLSPKTETFSLIRPDNRLIILASMKGHYYVCWGIIKSIHAIKHIIEIPLKRRIDQPVF